jgi:hypothetical protein
VFVVDDNSVGNKGNAEQSQERHSFVEAGEERIAIDLHSASRP